MPTTGEGRCDLQNKGLLESISRWQGEKFSVAPLGRLWDQYMIVYFSKYNVILIATFSFSYVTWYRFLKLQKVVGKYYIRQRFLAKFVVNTNENLQVGHRTNLWACEDKIFTKLGPSNGCHFYFFLNICYTWNTQEREIVLQFYMQPLSSVYFLLLPVNCSNLPLIPF